MRALDGLRGVAVIGVLVEHFAPNYWVISISPGGAGVTAFFVLSGYLITRLLMQYSRPEVSVGRAAKHFYWRRLLRLSPPYYLSIAVAALLGLEQMRSNWWLHALYLTNIQVGLSGAWVGGGTHFWSLATEEQFYLLWFVIVVVLPRRYLLGIILSCGAVTAVFRTGLYLFGLPALTTVLLPGNLVTLACGALLAYAEIHRGSSAVGALVERLARDPRVMIATGAVLSAVSLSLPFLDWPRFLLYPFAGAAFSATLVRVCADGRDGLLVRLFSLAPLVRIGKISYGIYVYHIFVADVLQRLVPRSWTVALGGWPWFVVLVAASLSVAQASWVLLERQALALKDQVRIGAGRPREAEPVRAQPGDPTAATPTQPAVPAPNAALHHGSTPAPDVADPLSPAWQATSPGREPSGTRHGRGLDDRRGQM